MCRIKKGPMQKTITLLFLTAFSTLVFGQTNYEKFKKLFKNNDTTKIKSLFAEWEKTNPNDPELYTSAINFYFSNSKQEIVSLDKQQKSKESFNSQTAQEKFRFRARPAMNSPPSPMPTVSYYFYEAPN